LAAIMFLGEFVCGFIEEVKEAIKYKNWDMLCILIFVTVVVVACISGALYYASTL
jgi:hypothetical protein